MASTPDPMKINPYVPWQITAVRDGTTSPPVLYAECAICKTIRTFGPEPESLETLTRLVGDHLPTCPFADYGDDTDTQACPADHTELEDSDAISDSVSAVYGAVAVLAAAIKEYASHLPAQPARNRRLHDAAARVLTLLDL